MACLSTGLRKPSQTTAYINISGRRTAMTSGVKNDHRNEMEKVTEKWPDHLTKPQIHQHALQKHSYQLNAAWPILNGAKRLLTTHYQAAACGSLLCTKLAPTFFLHYNSDYTPQRLQHPSTVLYERCCQICGVFQRSDFISSSKQLSQDMPKDSPQSTPASEDNLIVTLGHTHKYGQWSNCTRFSVRWKAPIVSPRLTLGFLTVSRSTMSVQAKAVVAHLRKKPASVVHGLEAKEGSLWNRDLAMEDRSGNRTGSARDRSWDCPDPVSSESDEYASDLDSVLSDEELSERHDYLRSLLRIIGEPPPFQYYTEFENVMNGPGEGSSFSFLRAEGTTVSLVQHSGVVAPFSNRTLSHPSFHSFYAAVSSQQSQTFPAEADDSRFEGQDSHSKAGLPVKSEASVLRSQDIHMPAIHQSEFFYTDPALPSGYRVYNHLSLPTRQVLQGLRLNTPSPIMSACMAPNIQRDNRTPSSHAPRALTSCQEQSDPVSKAERDAISSLLDLSRCGQSDSAGAEALEPAHSSRCVRQTLGDLQGVGRYGMGLPAGSGGWSVKGANQRRLPLLNKPSFDSPPNTELYKTCQRAEPEHEHSAWQHHPSQTSATSPEGRPSNAPSGPEIQTLDSARPCAGAEPVDLADIVPEIVGKIEVSSYGFPT
ncbi:uncharacterized protein LOC144481627 [Mustelus asterias]